MSARLWLAQLVGARRDVLRLAPGDLAKQATMGGVLLSTAVVAGISAFFATNSVFGLPWPVCTAIGLGWSVLVLNLDRMLVISMGAPGGATWSRVGMAVPRLLLALVIGSVISTPLVLRIFQPEIEAELTVMKAEAVERSKVELDQAYQRITELEKVEKGLQDTIAGRETQAVSDNPDVKTARTDYENADRAYQEADRAAQCELDGTCGTGQRGVGEAYRQKKAAADRAREVRDAAKQHLDVVIERTTGQVQGGAASDAEAARAKLPGVQVDLATQRDRRRAAEAETAQAQDKNTGLLARLEALDRVTDGHPSALLAHLLLFLLFVCIELLPVVAKLLSGLGGGSLYDKLVARQDADADAADQVRSTKDREIAEAKADGRLRIAREQIDAQVEAGRTAAQAMVERQTTIALNAVAVWGELATAATDRDLDHWLHAQSARLRLNGHRTANGHVTVSATELTVPMSKVRLPPSDFGPTGSTGTHG